MASLNKVILIGNLVADPELKKTQSGISVTSFRIAVSRKFTKDGETPKADFIDIIAWRSTAEFITQYFTKGMPILVCGSIQTRTWTDQNDQKRYAVEVVADEVSFVERKTEGRDTIPQATNAVNSPTQADTDGFIEVTDVDELPF